MHWISVRLYEMGDTINYTYILYFFKLITAWVGNNIAYEDKEIKLILSALDNYPKAQLLGTFREAARKVI